MSSSRLQHLHRLLQRDVDALPDDPQKPLNIYNIEDVVHQGGRDDHATPQQPMASQTGEGRNETVIATPPTHGDTGTNPFHAYQNDWEDSVIRGLDEVHNSRDEPFQVSDSQGPGDEDHLAGGTTSENDLNTRFERLTARESGSNELAGEDSECATLPIEIPEFTSASEIDMRPGQLCSPGDCFCPIITLSKFPYKFLQHADSGVADQFFAQGKFWSRSWDLFYVYQWDEALSKPLTLVKLEQFQQLINDINAAFPHLQIRVSDARWRDALTLHFPEHPHLRPRYLGRANSRDDYNKLTSCPPSIHYRPSGETDDMPCVKPDKRSIEAYKAMVEEAIDLNKNKNKAAKAKKQAERILMNKNMQQQLRRCQRYLGLRPKIETPPESTADAGLTWTESQRKIAKRAVALALPAIDPSEPCPYDFDGEPVLIAIDVEAHELNHNAITEIGIATLDTRDIKQQPPQKDGQNWRPSIRCRHFRIEEYRYHTNSQFVNGCPDRFEFGDSEFVELRDARHTVARCFKEPYSRVMSDEELMDTGDVKLTDSAFGSGSEERRIILVGHNPAADIDYLGKIGFRVLKVHNVVETLDTASMWRAFRQESQPTSLGNMLYHLDIAGWNLHNAGNDAAYTLQALLAIAVRDATQRRSKAAENFREERDRKELADSIQNAVEQVQERKKEWEIANEEEDDGGVPLPPDYNHASRSQLPNTVSRRGNEAMHPYRRPLDEYRRRPASGRNFNNHSYRGSNRDSRHFNAYQDENRFHRGGSGYSAAPENTQTSVFLDYGEAEEEKLASAASENPDEIML